VTHHDHQRHEPTTPGPTDPVAEPGSAAADAATAASGTGGQQGSDTVGESVADGSDRDNTEDAAGPHGGSAQSGDGGDGLDIEALADSDPRTKAELLAELLAAEAKRDEYLDDLRRSHADFENYRRRMMRDGALQRTGGKGDVAGALLEVLDDLDRTVQAAEGSPDADLATGVRLVAAKLLDALRQQGLERVDAVDVPFDPNVHEAVQQQPGEGIDGEPKVAAVLRPGYRMDDRVLRAAMVAVEN